MNVLPEAHRAPLIWYQRFGLMRRKKQHDLSMLPDCTDYSMYIQNAIVLITEKMIQIPMDFFKYVHTIKMNLTAWKLKLKQQTGQTPPPPIK